MTDNEGWITVPASYDRRLWEELEKLRPIAAAARAWRAAEHRLLRARAAYAEALDLETQGAREDAREAVEEGLLALRMAADQLLAVEEEQG